MFKTKAVIHSMSKEKPNELHDVVAIIHEKSSNDVIVEYKGVRYTAIFNPFVCAYYVDDIYGTLPDQHKCPVCGELLDEHQII